MIIYYCIDCHKSLKTLKDIGKLRTCPFCGGTMKKFYDV